MTVISATRMLARTDFAPGWVEVAGCEILDWGLGEPPTPTDHHVEILSPGLVDVHAHGGGGAQFGDTPPGALAVLEAHRSHGTTTMVASLVSASIEKLSTQIRNLQPLVESGQLGGIHLEGPWLSTMYKGAHDESFLRTPNLDDLATLVDAGGSAIAMVTLAGELPFALEAITELTNHGILVALGHSAADHRTTVRAIEAGVRGATHLFNAMGEILHRDGGAALALLSDDRVFLELICDGVHVHRDLIAHVMNAQPGRVVLISDAMAAAGAPDGDYTLGDLTVEVRDRRAHLAGTDTIAGSTLTLDRAVRLAIESGVAPEIALRAATENPSTYLNIRAGRIDTHTPGDLVCWDQDFFVTRVMYRGQWVEPSPSHETYENK
ncbi:MAG: N-acetylglucosamine-6-phosphate deacetylase [Propionibacteriaceae bacterium]|nr:N-acetylglucosamine-6-phosphate deacetylase [Propionibacteriaceae bacterium]